MKDLENKQYTLGRLAHLLEVLLGGVGGVEVPPAMEDDVALFPGGLRGSLLLGRRRVPYGEAEQGLLEPVRIGLGEPDQLVPELGEERHHSLLSVLGRPEAPEDGVQAQEGLGGTAALAPGARQPVGEPVGYDEVGVLQGRGARATGRAEGVGLGVPELGVVDLAPLKT